ncbi:Transcription factor spt20 [Thoreauomyces humboldtii]|nr:Transcription factor spt20 [Thoreauomyces humboldtii]
MEISQGSISRKQAASSTSFTEDAAPPPPAALVLHLYPTHFTMGERDATYQYNGPLKDFLEAVNRQELPPNASDLFQESDFHNGVERKRFEPHARAAPKGPLAEPALASSGGSATATRPVSGEPLPSVRHLLLRPTPSSLWADVCLLAKSTSESLTQDAALEVESKALLITKDVLNLDPDPGVARRENVKAYNETKYRIPRKRPRNWAAKEEDDEKKRESDKLMLIMDEVNPCIGVFTDEAYV